MNQEVGKVKDLFLLQSELQLAHDLLFEKDEQIEFLRDVHLRIINQPEIDHLEGELLGLQNLSNAQIDPIPLLLFPKSRKGS